MPKRVENLRLCERTMKNKKTSKKLLQDNSVISFENAPPWFIRGEGDKVYTGFPLIPETETKDSWVYGAITDFLEPDSKDGCTTGDGYVQTSWGRRAGLVWDTNGKDGLDTISEPEEGRWGVYGVKFSKPIKSLDDLVKNFNEVVPLLKKRFEEIVISEAFPKSLKKDVAEVVKIIPLPPEFSTSEQFKVFSDKEIIKIPYRLDYEEAKEKDIEKLTDKQKDILYCIYTRHHDGHIREKYLERIILSKNKWVVPFVFKLIGEYVIEIIILIYSNLEKLDTDSYIKFLKENKYFYNLTKQRVVSYWDCYFRHMSPKREDYVGQLIIDYFDGKLKEKEKSLKK